MDQKWLASGQPVLVLDAGDGEPGKDGYRPALVAVLPTEYHEPAQILDADPLAEDEDAETRGATEPGIVPGELRGPARPAQAVPGPATPVKSTTRTDAEDPTPAGYGGMTTAELLAELERRADADPDGFKTEAEASGFYFAEDADHDGAPDGDAARVHVAPSPTETTTEAGGNGAAAGSSEAGPAGATGAGGDNTAA